MTKSELTEKLISQCPRLQARVVDSAVKHLLEYISDALIRGERVEARGFGSFSLRYRLPRTGRNPRTGDKVALGYKYVAYFKPGKDLRDRVNTTKAD